MPNPDISKADLKRAQLPGPRSNWDEIQIFALTFNGYERFGESVGALANRHAAVGTVPTDIDELRGCLFFEQRRWRNIGEDPDEPAMRHIRTLIQGIRLALEKMPLKW